MLDRSDLQALYCLIVRRVEQDISVPLTAELDRLLAQMEALKLSQEQ